MRLSANGFFCRVIGADVLAAQAEFIWLAVAYAEESQSWPLPAESILSLPSSIHWQEMIRTQLFCQRIVAVKPLMNRKKKKDIPLLFYHRLEIPYTYLGFLYTVLMDSFERRVVVPWFLNDMLTLGKTVTIFWP